MSMAGGNPSLEIDVFANTSRLPQTLADAERQVERATQSVGKKVDDGFGKFANDITRKMSAAIGAGLAIKVVDDALRKVAEGLRDSQGVKAIGEAIGSGIVESIRGLPIAGGLMEVASQLSNMALGDPMGRDIDVANYQAFQRTQNAQREAGPGAFRELQMAGATGESLDAMRREQELARLTAIGARAKAGRTQVVDGVEMELEEGILASVSAAIAAGMKAFDDQVAAKRAQELERVAQERKRAEEAQAREEERLAEAAKRDEERRIKAQEDAYDRFVEGNAREAIMALEAQLEMASSANAPSRGQRLAGLMQNFGMGEGETALGGFTFALGDAATVSQNILANAEKQLASLEHIEDLQQQLVDLQKESGLR